MIHTKQLYEAPAASLLVVRFEENIMSDPKASAAASSRENYEFYDLD